MTSQKNDLNKNFLMNIQKKLVKALKINVKIQMIYQKNDLDNEFLLDLQTTFAKVLKKSLGWEK